MTHKTNLFRHSEKPKKPVNGAHDPSRLPPRTSAIIFVGGRTAFGFPSEPGQNEEIQMATFSPLSMKKSCL